MSYSLFHAAVFGVGNAGLGTVGYALFNANGSANGSRITAGITERAPGTYAATITMPTAFLGEIRWDTGGGSPIYASAPINSSDSELLDVAISSRSTWDALTSALTTAGSVGKRLVDFVTTLVYAPPSGGGTGANFVTIVVKDAISLVVLQNAQVRVIAGVQNFILSTDVNGIALFSLDAATYRVMITLAGYQFTPALVVVAGTVVFNMSMVQVLTAILPGGTQLEV